MSHEPDLDPKHAAEEQELERAEEDFQDALQAPLRPRKSHEGNRKGKHHREP